MRIAFAIQSLDGGGGTETYVTTIGDHLQRFGHDVWVCGRGDGLLGSRARDLGLRVVSRPEDLPATLDAVLVQDAPSALEIAGVHADVAQVYVWHSEFFDVQVPPQIDGLTDHMVAMSGAARRKIGALAVRVPLTELSQPVDTQRFRPRAPLPDRPRSAISLGNYLSGERLDLLRGACERSGIELSVAGAMAGGVVEHSEDVMNEVDIVFAKGKTAIEAMACGRAVFVYDVFGADGWVTADTYPALNDSNFAGNRAGATPTVAGLSDEIGRYDREMGLVNRDLAVANHGAVNHTASLVEVIERVLAGRGGQPPRAALDHAYELARLARVNWRHESRSFHLAQLLHLVETERDAMRMRLDEVELERRRLAEQLELVDVTGAPRAREPGA